MPVPFCPGTRFVRAGAAQRGRECSGQGRQVASLPEKRRCLISARPPSRAPATLSHRALISGAAVAVKTSWRSSPDDKMSATNNAATAISMRGREVKLSRISRASAQVCRWFVCVSEKWATSLRVRSNRARIIVMTIFTITCCLRSRAAISANPCNAMTSHAAEYSRRSTLIAHLCCILQPLGAVRDILPTRYEQKNKNRGKFG